MQTSSIGGGWIYSDNGVADVLVGRTKYGDVANWSGCGIMVVSHKVTGEGALRWCWCWCWCCRLEVLETSQKSSDGELATERGDVADCWEKEWQDY